MDHVHLLGSEAVEKAGYAMRAAADSMQQSASYMDESLKAHQRAMEDFVYQLEQIELSKGNGEEA